MAETQHVISSASMEGKLLLSLCLEDTSPISPYSRVVQFLPSRWTGKEQGGCQAVPPPAFGKVSWDQRMGNGRMVRGLVRAVGWAACLPLLLLLWQGGQAWIGALEIKGQGVRRLGTADSSIPSGIWPECKQAVWFSWQKYANIPCKPVLQQSAWFFSFLSPLGRILCNT